VSERPGHDAEMVAPPPFGILRIRRGAPGGRLETTFIDETVARITGANVDGFVATAAGRALLAEAEALLALADHGRSHAFVEIFLGDVAGSGRRLHARLYLRISAVGEPVITVVLHDLTGHRAIRPIEPVGASDPAVIRMVRGDAGALRLTFVDESIRRRLGGDPVALAASPAGRALLDRAAAILALDRWSAGLALNELTLPSADNPDRALHARFVRLTSPDGAPSIIGIISDPAPAILGQLESARRSDGLLRLLRLSDILLERPPQQEGLERIVDEIATAPGFHSAAIAFRVNHDDRLEARAHRGVAGVPAGTGFWLPCADGPCRLALEARRIVVARRPDAASTCLYVPIIAADEVLGLLDVCAEAELPWGLWDEEIVGSYADYIAAFVTGAPARARLVNWPGTRGDGIDIAQRLTARQCDVLFQLVELGASNREIAERLGLVEATVKVHMREILNRLGVTSRTEAVHLVFSRAPRWLAEARAHHRASLATARTAA
jgi:DNA-binding CsgD family transcriptional regulator